MLADVKIVLSLVCEFETREQLLTKNAELPPPMKTCVILHEHRERVKSNPAGGCTSDF